MDDFGTGYSSLSFLIRLPIDEIKIDRSFIDHMFNGESNKELINIIIDMASVFKLKTVAEGIETKEQLEL